MTASLYFRPRILAILFLGFSSGLPLALTASTLGAWLQETGVSLASIGLFAAVGTPYALKFLWSPLIDGTDIPLFSKLGRRRGWLVATQAALLISIAAMGMIRPGEQTLAMASLALLVAFLSASQDTAIDAFRVELLQPEEYGAGAANAVLGYRLGMIASTAGALHLASAFGWQTAYMVMALLMLVGTATVLLLPEPAHPRQLSGNWFFEHIAAPLKDFITREHWLLILLFIILYKLADAFMGVVTNPFLLQTGFSKDEIADIVKLYGLIATIAGSFLGGVLVFRLGMVKSLWLCGILHAATNLMFAALALRGHDTWFLGGSIFMENLSGGAGTAAFVAYISALCNLRFTATQYALLSSLSAFGRTWLSTPAGWVAAQTGWPVFFTLASALALPGLLLLWLLNKRTKEEKHF